MMRDDWSGAQRAGRQAVRVEELPDLDYLIKESEMLTGLPGRVFYVRTADRLVHLQLVPCGYQLCDISHQIQGRLVYVLRSMLRYHPVGWAMRNGLLHTWPLDGSQDGMPEEYGDEQR